MKRVWVCFTAWLLLTAPGRAQNASLNETFDWMTNTLKPSEGNNSLTHRPTPRPYVKEWRDKEIDPYHTENITGFSHNACHVEFDVEEFDNDTFPLLGKWFLYKRVDTFDLRDIDPHSIRIKDSCAPVETPSGNVEPWNCQDTQGKIVEFQTIDAKPNIREEGRSSSGKSQHGLWAVVHNDKYNLDHMCKLARANGDPDNGAYCDQAEREQKPKDLTSFTLGFTTPQYAKRFTKALQHAVELCGGRPSAF